MELFNRKVFKEEANLAGLHVIVPQLHQNVVGECNAVGTLVIREFNHCDARFSVAQRRRVIQRDDQRIGGLRLAEYRQEE